MALPASSPLGYAQLTVTAVTTLAAATGGIAIPAGATYAVVIPENNGIRYRDDGTNPTAAIGVPVAAGATLTYNGLLATIKIVSQSGTSLVNVAYYAARTL